jgi:predicted NUDIX family NTP pyrophosphohydrolase
MGQLALETGSSSFPELPEYDIWSEQKAAGFKEVGERREHGVEIALFWNKVGNMVLLGAHTDTGEHVVTIVEAEAAIDSFTHPSQYFSHEASDRIFGQAA